MSPTLPREGLHVVDIGEMKVLTGGEDTLVTYSLGSCVGLAVFDPVAKVGGLIHCMLPVSKKAPDRAKERPAMFVDTGVPLMLTIMLNEGAKKDRLVVKLAGGSVMMDEDGVFEIGKRNIVVARKVLWKNSIKIASEETGGSEPRSVYLKMGDGSTLLNSSGKVREI